jgi:predicted alpha/beta superfamily hydrolase
MDESTSQHDLTRERPDASAPSAPELQLHELRSGIFRNTRLLRVWVPPGYHNAENRDRRYPVFYLNDGQNLFEAATAFGGVDWGVGRTAELLIGQGAIPPLILAGIDNMGSERIREYLPYRSFSPPILRPRGKRYPDFLLREVMPFMAEHFRIAPGPEHTGLGGSSLGGLIALFTILDRPGIFGRVLIESPSLFISHRRILRYSRYFRQWPRKICLGMGTRESGREDKDRQFVEDLRELERILRHAGLGDDRLRVQIAEGAAHNEGEWGRRFPEALAFLFGNNST